MTRTTDGKPTAQLDLFADSTTDNMNNDMNMSEKTTDKTASPMKDSGIEWIGEIPAEWALRKAKAFINFGSGTDPKTDGDVPVYGSGMGSFKTCGEYKEGPCVLVGRKGTINIPHYINGRYWNVDTAFDATIINSNFLLRYYYYLAMCFDYSSYATQTTVPSMTKENYSNMSLPVPPLAEQVAIASRLDSITSRIDEAVRLIDEQLADLKDYRKALISEVVTRGVPSDSTPQPTKPTNTKWIPTIPTHWKTQRGKYLFAERNERGNKFNLEMLSPTQAHGVIPQSQLDSVVLMKKGTDLRTLKTIHKGDFCISLRSFQGGFEYCQYEGVLSPAYHVLYPIVPIYDRYWKYLFKSYIST